MCGYVGRASGPTPPSGSSPQHPLSATTSYLYAPQDVGPATAVLRCTDSLSQAMAAANVRTLQSVVCDKRSLHSSRYWRCHPEAPCKSLLYARCAARALPAHYTPHPRPLPPFPPPLTLNQGLALAGAEQPGNRADVTEQFKHAFAEHVNPAGVAVAADCVGSAFTAAPSGAVVLIAGTGSICFWTDAQNRIARAGGWGHMLGDEGSAYWIAASALRKAMRVMDGMPMDIAPGSPTCTRAEASAVVDVALKYFGASIRSQLLQYVHSGFDKAHIAGFTVHLLPLAEACNPIVCGLFKEAGQWLGATLRSVVPAIAAAQMSDHPGEGVTEFDVTVAAVGSVWKSWALLKAGFMQYASKPVDLSSPALGASAAALPERTGQVRLRTVRLVTLRECSAMGAAVWGAATVCDCVCCAGAWATRGYCTALRAASLCAGVCSLPFVSGWSTTPHFTHSLDYGLRSADWTRPHWIRLQPKH